MARYSISGQTAAGAGLVIINLTGDGTVRPKMYDLIIGSDATPADAAGEFNLSRCTTTGTGTTLTENKLDPNSATATCAGQQGTYSPVPTVTANSDMLNIALNQRATFRWVAFPGGEIIGAATASNGLALVTVAYTSGTPNINATMHWEE